MSKIVLLLLNHDSDFEKNGVWVTPVHTFCEELRLP